MNRLELTTKFKSNEISNNYKPYVNGCPIAGFIIPGAFKSVCNLGTVKRASLRVEFWGATTA